jgi:ribosomal protein S18 acetylase RimI-like enzyme
VTDRGDYLVIETPANPSFYWGNLLYFAAPPTADDMERWPAVFRAAFVGRDQVRHMTFAWDTRDGSAGAAGRFVNLGYKLERNVVLTAESVRRPPRCAEDVIVRRLLTDADFELAIGNQLMSKPTADDAASYERFTRRQFERWRRMSAAGLGDWWGAFVGDRLAGDLGLYVQGGLGRFQAVSTHPDFRRRGVCGRLVHDAARSALADGCEKLVMVADADYHAARIYESIGFAATERNVGVCLPAAT